MLWKVSWSVSAGGWGKEVGGMRSEWLGVSSLGDEGPVELDKCDGCTTSNYTAMYT
jgi:hypothetical protein